LQEREYADKIRNTRTGWRAAGASFLVLFAAEWGDLSQLLTASLVAAGRPAIPVFAGSWLGLIAVAGAGVLLGKVLLRYVRLSVIRYVGGAVCAILAGVTVVAAVQAA
jgi:putative Ca2+/H+ antiporter (TMEM165/GDT1 family)